MANETKGTVRSIVEDLEAVLRDPGPVAEDEEDPEARSGGTGTGTLISTVKPSLNPITYAKRLLKKNLKMGSVVAPLVAPGAGSKAAGAATKIAGGINDESVDPVAEDDEAGKEVKPMIGPPIPSLSDLSVNPVKMAKRMKARNDKSVDNGVKTAMKILPALGGAGGAAGAAKGAGGLGGALGGALGGMGDSVEVETDSVLDERKKKASAALHSPDTQAGGKASSPHEPDTKAGGSPGKAKSGKELEKKAREKRKSKKAAGGRNPFKTKAKLGPGPRNGTNSQTRRWKCSCRTPYKCNCRAGKLTKVITIGRNYKRSYNKEYKQWRKGQRG